MERGGHLKKLKGDTNTEWPQQKYEVRRQVVFDVNYQIHARRHVTKSNRAPARTLKSGLGLAVDSATLMRMVMAEAEFISADSILVYIPGNKISVYGNCSYKHGICLAMQRNHFFTQ